ncbi:hypothetical protein Syun_019246 [Stephania yunnanensis]|uniref:Uncharacterized protein n=1 Tax=Stephania yunnanensis TaxID=152371 RepID=A0AAP0NX46_9MAGN
MIEMQNLANLYIYCRWVYGAISYLYGNRFIGPITDLILSLREELHVQPYHNINWSKTRYICANTYDAPTHVAVPSGRYPPSTPDTHAMV